MTETLKRVDDQGRICGSIEREGAWIMETPQVFDLALLRQAYAEVIASGPGAEMAEKGIRQLVAI